MRILSALLLLALLGLACDSAVEEQTPTPSVTAASTTSAITVSPGPTVPPGWQTYTDPGGLWSLRYPADWFYGGADNFYSTDPATLPTSLPGFTDEIVEVEVIYNSIEGSDSCGPLFSLDRQTGEVLGLLPPATEASLGGLAGARIVRLQGDSAIEGHLTRIDGFGTVRDGYCWGVTAYYTEADPDVGTFLTIVESFAFGNHEVTP